MNTTEMAIVIFLIYVALGFVCTMVFDTFCYKRNDIGQKLLAVLLFYPILIVVFACIGFIRITMNIWKSFIKEVDED